MQYNLGNGMTLVELYDNLGRTEEAGLILPNNTTKYYQWYDYNQNTGNLTARIIGDTNSDEEEFTYDALDRLTSWTKNNTTLDYLYETDGSLYFKRDLGSMYYYLNNPYAISDLENPLGPLALPQSYVSSAYNEFGKASQLSNGNNITTIDYGPDFQRWKMTGSDKAFYFDNYEEITVNNFKRNYAYLGNNVMAVSDNTNGVRFYYLMKDHLGSIIGIVNVNGDDVFTASYDPWGRQTVTVDSLHFHRGFTGHEMLPKYDLINMNDRLYDPYLARFLSPDNYVQMPDFSQSFNRYSYCLNNPLKYTDPSGELFGIDDVFLLTMAANIYMNACIAIGTGENIGKSILNSVVSSVATYGLNSLTNGVGGLFGHATGAWGTEIFRAGAHGLVTGISNMITGGSFESGFLSGSFASLIGSGTSSLGIPSHLITAAMGAVGGITSELSGGDWFGGTLSGINIGLLNPRWEMLPDGTPHCILDELVVVGRNLSGIHTLGVMASASSNMHNTMSVLTKRAYFGSNRHFYFADSKTNNYFRGNQHVNTHSLNIYSKQYKRVGTGLEILSYGIDGYFAYREDGGTIGRNVQRSLTISAGRAIGASYGARIVGHAGIYIGGYLGGMISFGFGAIPATTIGEISGSIVGGIIGDAVGGWAGALYYDNFY